MINESFKIKINSREESIEVQEILLKNGSRWPGENPDCISHPTSNLNSTWVALFHYVFEHKITGTTSVRWFEEHQNTEISIEEFKQKYDRNNPIQVFSKKQMFDYVEYCINNINEGKSKDELLVEFLKL